MTDVDGRSCRRRRSLKRRLRGCVLAADGQRALTSSPAELVVGLLGREFDDAVDEKTQQDERRLEGCRRRRRRRRKDERRQRMKQIAHIPSSPPPLVLVQPVAAGFPRETPTPSNGPAKPCEASSSSPPLLLCRTASRDLSASVSAVGVCIFGMSGSQRLPVAGSFTTSTSLS